MLARTLPRPDRVLPNAVLIFTLVLPVLLALPQPGATQDPPAAAETQAMPDLVGALRATPGVLGVETAETASRKQVIFAWFEDKAAVLRWYYSDTHRMVQDQFMPDRPSHTPLAHVAEGAGPILVVASVTPSDSVEIEGGALPITQIAIELYQPLPGGLAVGGRFAPEGLEVPHMIEARFPSSARDSVSRP